ncbi:MAG: hypothetical protein ACKOED_14040 [Aestuariivirga sp.]|uniref:hypothetical protein n=1 Tax=Aestuariivirga sp. TaxID=2650926 RepID=UPI0038D0ACA6
MSVHGTGSRPFRLHRSGRAFGLIIEPEPRNPHDANALKVVGWGASNSHHVGYVEAMEAARAAERYPRVPLAAEFYSVYVGARGFIDIRFFLSAPAECQPTSSGRVRGLLEYTRDELLVLSYAARADNKLGRLEADILNRYAFERARDFGVSLVDEDVSDLKRWCREQAPTSDEVEASIHRLADEPSFSAAELWDLIEVVMGIDGKISKKEKAAADELAAYIREAISETVRD